MKWAGRGGAIDHREDEKALCTAWFQPNLTDEDRAWLARHFELMDRQPPKTDTSWITMELIR